MKKQILTLVIGILIGAIIATACFMIFNKTSTSDEMGKGGQQGQMGEPPSMDGNSVGKPGEKGGTTGNETTTAPTTTENLVTE